MKTSPSRDHTTAEQKDRTCVTEELFTVGGYFFKGMAFVKKRHKEDTVRHGFNYSENYPVF